MKKKYEVLSHYVMMEIHIVEIDIPEGEEPEEEELAELLTEENLIKSDGRDWEIVNIEEMRGNNEEN